MSKARLFLVLLLITFISTGLYAVAQEKSQEETKLQSDFWSDVNGRLDKMSRDVKSRLRGLVEKEDQSFSDRTVQVPGGSRGAVKLLEPINTCVRKGHWNGVFVWEEVESADSYDIEIYRNMETVVSEKGLTSARFDSTSKRCVFEPDTTYRWVVKAHTGANTLSSSNSEIFKCADCPYFIMLNRRDSKQVEKALKEIQKVTPGNTQEDKLQGLALTAALLKDYRLHLESSEILKEALRLDPKNEESLYMLADVYSKMEMSEECEQILETMKR